MMNDIFLTSFEVSQRLAQSTREKRLSLNLSQKSLSETSGVSYSVIKKFELTGKISLESLLKIAAALGCLNEFTKLFQVKQLESVTNLDEVMNKKTRKRGRK